MKKFDILVAFQFIILSTFLFNFNNVFVLCDGTGSVLSDVMKGMLAQAPVKILSLVQLGLLARLLSQGRNRLGSAGADGIDNDRDGDIDEEDEWALDSNKKNVMIFMGKHNIQVSNHGLKGEEETEGEDDNSEEEEEDGEDGDGDDDDIDDSDENDGYDDNELKYKKEKYTKGKGNKIGYGSPEEEGNNKKNKKTKTYKKANKKRNTKLSYGGDDEEDVDENDGDGPDYNPTFISYANSNNKPTQTLLPWLKNFLKKADKTVSTSGNSFEDSNIMASPNGFPIGGSKLESFSRRNDGDPDQLELTDSELNELLSHPQVIDFLNKLNESLVNQSTNGELKRSKRQIGYNMDQNLTAEESRQSKQIRHSSNQFLKSRLKAKNVDNSVENHLGNSMTYSSGFEPIIDQKSAPKWLFNDLKSESSVESVQGFQPKESTKSFKLDDYMTFKPLPPQYKVSSLMGQPFFEMQTTDDDQYGGPSNEGSNYGIGGSQYGNDGSEYGDKESKYGSGLSGHMYGGSNGMYGDINTMPYGGLGGISHGLTPNLPVMDLTYWSKVIKETEKKKKKKKYITTEAPNEEPDEVDNEDDEDEDQEEQEEEEEEEDGEERRKIHTTVQIIKSGSKTGNIGINSGGEDRQSRGWVKGLPGFRQLFGRR